MNPGNLLWVLLLLPALGGGISLLLKSGRSILRLVAAGVFLIATGTGVFVFSLSGRLPILSRGGWLHLDALTAFHLLVMTLVFLLCSLFAVVYFQEGGRPTIDLAQARRFGALWFGALTAMTFVLLANNLGLMWVGVEATTLITAFLICLHSTPVSLEATWKYLIVCSVGVAFAFMGILLIGAAAAETSTIAGHFLDWTHLRRIAGGFDPKLMKLAFVFLLVGFGTKAGLAPFHNWLPDAHSQAPAPVSALFSGFLLNSALYALMRIFPLINAAKGISAWGGRLFVIFGLLSILLAGVFLLSQHDLKRFFAYCSVENIGIIALGLGLGPLGITASLFHTLYHSTAKVLGFSAAGRIGHMYGTMDMRRISGALRFGRWWGVGLLVSLLALSGMAPLAIFFSKFLMMRAAALNREYLVLILLLFGSCLVFITMIRRAIDLSWGEPPVQAGPAAHDHRLEKTIVLVTFALLLILGMWQPRPVLGLIRQAAAIVGGQKS